MRFSWSTHLLMCLSLESLTFIIRTDLPILVELIDLVNSQRTLLRWLTFLLGPQTVTLIVRPLDLFLSSDAIKCSTMAFPSLWNSDLLLFDCPLTFHQIHNRMPGFIPYPIFWVIDGFEWFWMASFHKNIQLMLEFLKAAFVVLHFSYYALLTFLMMLSVILLSVLMILSATPRHFLGIPFSWS